MVTGSAEFGWLLARRRQEARAVAGGTRGTGTAMRSASPPRSGWPANRRGPASASSGPARPCRA